MRKLGNFLRGRNPFFSIKRVPSPQTPQPPKRTTKDLPVSGLWAGRVGFEVFDVGSLRELGLKVQEWLWRAFRGWLASLGLMSGTTWQRAVCRHFFDIITRLSAWGMALSSILSMAYIFCDE